jgi:hypothetical protein
LPALGGRGITFFGAELEPYQEALQDLFGLTVGQGSRYTPFGGALLTLLALADLQEDEGEPDEEGEESPEDVPEGAGEEAGEDELMDVLALGHLQAVLQPYFPDYREVLILSWPEEREGTFVFKVTLPDVWRVIAIGHDATLDDLADAILDSVKFDRDHLYQFTYHDRFGRKTNVAHPACDEDLFTDEVTVGEVPLAIGQSMRFWFDFGDDWFFDVKLERVEPPGAVKGKLPRVLEKHGKAPQQYPNSDW